MWVLTNNNLSTNVTSYTSFNTTSTLTPNTSLTNTATLTSVYSNYSEVTQLTSVGTIPNTYTITTDAIPTVIRTESKVFIPAINLNSPQVGEFVYSNGIATIYSDTALTSVRYLTTGSGIRSFRITNIPSILYQLPIEGGFAISDQFQDHPSGSLIFITSQKNVSLYRSKFKLGNLIELYDYSFVINGYNEEINPDTVEVKIVVSLRGKWDAFLNKPIPLKANVSSISTDYTDPDCTVGGTATNSVNVTKISIQELASRINTNVEGISFKVKVPRNVSASDTTTLNTEITKWIDINSSFLRLTDKNSIQIVKLDNVNTWYFTENDLLAPFTTSINRRPDTTYTETYNNLITQNINFNSLVPTTFTSYTQPTLQEENTSVISLPAYNNYELADDFPTYKELAKREQVRDLPPQFKIRTPVRRTYVKGDPNPHLPPDNVTKLTTLDLNFDRSGVTKTEIIVTEEDGSPLTEIIRKYGFAYRAVEIAVNLGTDNDVYLEGTPATFWGLIEETTITYNYDENTGYLLGTDTVGRRLLRLAAEDDSLPSILLNGSDDAADILESNSYIFKWVSVLGAKRYLLVQHRDYYRNFDVSQKLYKKCNRDGSSSWEVDPTYVEPMFCLIESEEIQCFSFGGNPDNVEREPTDPILPPLTTGQETYNRTRIDILPSQNTNPGFEVDLDAPTEDRYISYVSNFTAQEPRFGAITENTNVQENSGIPPIHTRKQPKYQAVENDNEQPRKPTGYRYVLWTNPYTGNYPRGGTVKIEKADRFRDAKTAIYNQLKIDDIRNTLSSTTTVPLNLNIKTGDICIFDIGGIRYKRRVVGANHRFIFDGIDSDSNPLVVGDGTQLTLGIERDFTLNSKKEKVPTSLAVNLGTKGLVLGSVLALVTRTRGNYDGQEL